MKNELKDALNMAFYAPEPKNKQVFLKNLRPREVGMIEMLFQQVRYIRVSVWILTAAIIALTILGAWMKRGETGELISVIMPFLAAVSVLENNRSRKYGMSELEMVTRFSLRSVIFARMLILGLVFLFMIAITSPILVMAFGGEMLVTAMHMLIPYLVTMTISLQIERSIWGRRLEYGTLAIAMLITALMVWIRDYDMALVNGYMEMVKNWGVLIVLVLAVITVFEQWRTIECVEELA
jgi:hypothetical protein